MNHSYRGTKGIVQGSLESKWAPWAQARHEEKLVGWNIEYQGWPISSLQGKLKNLEEKRSQENTILNRMIVEDELLLVEKVLTQKLLKKEEGKGKPKAPPPPVPPPPQGDQPQPKGLPEGKKKKKRAVVDGQIVEYEIKYIELNSQSIVDSWNEREWIGGVPNQTSFIKIKISPSDSLIFTFPPNDRSHYTIIDSAVHPVSDPSGSGEVLYYYENRYSLTKEAFEENTGIDFEPLYDPNWKIKIHYSTDENGVNYIEEFEAVGILASPYTPFRPPLTSKEKYEAHKKKVEAKRRAKEGVLISKGLTPEQAKAKIEEEEAKAEERIDNEKDIKEIMKELGIPYDDLLDTLSK